MAKKKISNEELENFDDVFDPTASLEKMPVDISGGKVPIAEYMLIPVELIDTFGLKDGADFSSYSAEKSEAMINSIREHGVIEAITVRPNPAAPGRYELLAGEQRLSHAKEAGLEKINAHVMQVDDDDARAVFSLTNILRRNLKPSDLVVGWWHAYQSMKAKGTLNAFRQGTADPDLPAELAGEDASSTSYRQMMRYVRVHSLSKEWLDALDSGVTTLSVAEKAAGLPKEIQAELLPYLSRLTDAMVDYLLKVREGKVKGVKWDEKIIPKTVNAYTDKVPVIAHERGLTADQFKLFKKAKPKIVNAALMELRPEDYGRAEDVIKEALRQYYGNME